MKGNIEECIYSLKMRILKTIPKNIKSSVLTKILSLMGDSLSSLLDKALPWTSFSVFA